MVGSSLIPMLTPCSRLCTQHKSLMRESLRMRDLWGSRWAATWGLHCPLPPPTFQEELLSAGLELSALGPCRWWIKSE